MVTVNTDYPFVTGPASAVDNDAASFDGTTGKKLKDSGGSAGNVTGPASSTTGDLPKFADTTGKVLSDSGILASNVVQGPASATDGNLCVFNGTTGKLIKDGGAPSAAGFVQYSEAKAVSGTITTNSTNFVDLTGVTVTITTGAHRCLITFIASGFNDGGAAVIYGIFIDGVEQCEQIYSGVTNGNYPVAMTYMSGVLTAASHTFKIQWKVSANNGNTYGAANRPAYIGVTETGLTT